MSLEADIVKLLTGPHSGAAGQYEDRVYADYAPQHTTYPCAVYENDRDEPDTDWRGANGYAVHDVTVTLLAEEKADTIDDAAHIEATLHGFKGSTFNTGSGTTSLSTTILLISVRLGVSYYDDERNLYIRELDLEIHTTT